MANNVTVLPFRESTSNTDILAAIRKNASPDYQRRIPDATKAGVSETLKRLLDYRPAYNEFVDALVNQIGLIVVRNKIWANPLAVFKRGMLEFGSTIEEIQVGLIEAKVYNSDRDGLEGEIFGQHRPDVQSSFHTINRQNYYPLTINENLLHRAFTSSDNGLSQFIASLMSSQTTSDYWDEFLLTTSLLSEYEKNGGFFKVNVPDIGANSDTVEQDAKYALRQVRQMASTLGFLSTNYNASGMPVFASKEELVFLVTPEAQAAIDVEALAGAFNMDKAEFSGRTVVIPQEHWGIPGAQAILTTEDFFMIADNKIETTSQWNPISLHNNYFLHHWQVISASRFVPAVLFWTGAGDVITVDETPVTSISAPAFNDRNGTVVTSLERGELYSIDALAVTTPAGGPNSAVRFELSGSYSGRTYVSQTGMVSIALDEAATAIAVNIYAVDDNNTPTLKTVLTANIVGDRAILWPNPEVEIDSNDNGLYEVTPDAVPVAPTSGANKNKVTIPATEGVDYKNGATVVTGQTITLTANATITATAQTGYEIATGAVTTWNLVFTA
jgi:hypothetical protein